MNASTITALAAISGSMVGALGSLAASWITQRHQDRRDLLAKKIVHREALYSGFISEAARLLVDALEHNFNDPKNLIPSYALLGRIPSWFLTAGINGRGKNCKADYGRLHATEPDGGANTVCGGKR